MSHTSSIIMCNIYLYPNYGLIAKVMAIVSVRYRLGASHICFSFSIAVKTYYNVILRGISMILIDCREHGYSDCCVLRQGCVIFLLLLSLIREVKGAREMAARGTHRARQGRRAIDRSTCTMHVLDIHKNFCFKYRKLMVTLCVCFKCHFIYQQI